MITANMRPLSDYTGDERATILAILAVILLTTLVLVLRHQAPAPPPVPATQPPLKPVNAKSAGTLENMFEASGYRWPPDGKVPPLALQRMPPDMGDLDVDRKKTLFLRSVLPLVLAENRRIRHQRQFVQQSLENYGSLDDHDRRHLERIAAEYKVEDDLATPAVRHQLLRRVDTVPVALALAQAADESAWGNSRFTLQHNSLFGVWTWEEDHGVVPRRRKEGEKHLVRTYPDLRTSVRHYMHNLNVGFAYQNFRKQRRALRLEGKPLNAMVLAGLLDRYSQRGDAYIAEIRRIILNNGLNRLGPLQLGG
jgi:Bax protein